MNLGLIQRSLREVWFASLAMSGIVFGITALFCYAMPRVQARFMQRSFIPQGVRQFRDAVFGGVDSTGASIAEVAFAIAWSHPLVLVPILAHAILVQTRVPAAEVERGTIDVLLALPVSRWNLYVSETVAWLLTAIFTLAAMYAGAFFGAQFIKPEIREVATPDWGRLAMVVVNLGLAYAVVGCLASLFTTIIDRRTWAVLCTLVLTLFSLLVSFLYTIDPALEFTKSMRFMSILDYYKPLAILRTGEWQWRDMGILGSTALTLWIVTGVIFSRRDVTTT